ncbi:type II toxin-antitoxin system RnlB family antitoxin [Intestinibacter bartlettii]|uniref:type II toxin-antitoxin system RnlB family antitoxin n=1 Tax=Intestinibacter bartlettii TaxID=261299 RepID=UPI0034A1842F
MDEFAIVQLDDIIYKYLIVCLSCNGILDYLDSIECKLSNEIIGGKIIVDQLFITGNSCNRFVEINFKNKKINLSTAKNIKPPKFILRKSLKILQNNTGALENSILTESIKDRIIKGEIV